MSCKWAGGGPGYFNFLDLGICFFVVNFHKLLSFLFIYYFILFFEWRSLSRNVGPVDRPKHCESDVPPKRDPGYTQSHGQCKAKTTFVLWAEPSRAESSRAVMTFGSGKRFLKAHSIPLFMYKGKIFPTMLIDIICLFYH